jgi:hypothetical protein
MDNKMREEGYYWVLFDGNWVIAKYYRVVGTGYDNGYWDEGNNTWREEDAPFSEIKESRILRPNEI